MAAAGLGGDQAFSTVSGSAEPGAYLLLIGLARPVVLEIERFPGVRFSAGWYVYAGNANGPGGLRARVGRHLRRDKRAHWHVDHLAGEGSVAPLCFPGADECGLVESLIAAPRFAVPVPGFGSTDCRRCDSHLLSWLPT